MIGDLIFQSIFDDELYIKNEKMEKNMILTKWTGSRKYYNKKMLSMKAEWKKKWKKVILKIKKSVSTYERYKVKRYPNRLRKWNIRNLKMEEIIKYSKQLLTILLMDKARGTIVSELSERTVVCEFDTFCVFGNSSLVPN